MIFPFKRRQQQRRELKPRAGGGGGGRGGGGGGGRSGGSSGGSAGSGGGGGRSTPISGTCSSGRTAVPGGGGGGPVSTIPAGSAFAGRSEGGGTRDQVYGTSAYGSGYPNNVGRGVEGRGFPFYFWPVAWGGAAGLGGGAYLHSREYGRSDNISRPGGPMVFATFASSTSNSSFHLVADNTTVISLIEDVRGSCASKNLNTDKSSTTPTPYNDTDPSSPQPESTIQYYRASSVALTLDGYNNSAALSDQDGQPDTPLPSTLDTTLKDCLNQTIGTNVPLIQNGATMMNVPGTLALVWVLLYGLMHF